MSAAHVPGARDPADLPLGRGPTWGDRAVVEEADRGHGEPRGGGGGSRVAAPSTRATASSRWVASSEDSPGVSVVTAA